MKVCPICGYVEHWGAQCLLVCPNCDEVHLSFRGNNAEKACSGASDKVVLVSDKIPKRRKK